MANMRAISSDHLASLWIDLDVREERLREIAIDRLLESPPPTLSDQIVATYFLALRTKQLAEVGEDIAYHATSGWKNPTPGSLVAECTGKTVGVDAWDPSGRIGLIHMAFPTKMLLNASGGLTSCDLLHTVAGAILFDVYENQDCMLLNLTIPPQVVRTFPGPAHGWAGVRRVLGVGPREPVFGTILKPTAGVTPGNVGALVEQVAQHSLIAFVKEDENLYPRLDYSSAADRTRQAVDAIARVRSQREGKGIIFAPHVSGSPHEILDTVAAVVDAGATGVMLSESFAGGAVRAIREFLRDLDDPPAIYGHNAGIGVKTRCIWREVIDGLARLDGIDFRQTAPVRPGPPFIRPYRAEWEASELTLSEPLENIRPVMISRAGGLDHGNVILNLQDAAIRGRTEKILFLAGSAINSIKSEQGDVDAGLGVAAMHEAVSLHEIGVMADVPMDSHVEVLLQTAKDRKLTALVAALQQRYPTQRS